MKIAIHKIKVAARIRKEVGDIKELATSILEHGLITPITVMPCSTTESGEEYQLLAGLRRVRAMQMNGETEIDAKVFPASDAEAALKIEYSENEQREPFTYSEKMDYAKLIEEIESAKAKERKLAGIKLSDNDLADHGAEGRKRETRSVVGSKIGMSGKQYDRAKYIVAHAPLEIIDELDRGERSIRGTYDELRAKEKAENELKLSKNEASITVHNPPPMAEFPKQQKSPKLSDKTKEERAMAMLSPKEREAVERLNAFIAMSPEDKIIELETQLKAERSRASTVETELTRLKDELHNAVYHRDGIISSLEKQLENALSRVKELEAINESN